MILVKLLAILSRGGFSDYLWDVGPSRKICWGFGRGVAASTLHAWHAWSKLNPNQACPVKLSLKSWTHAELFPSSLLPWRSALSTYIRMLAICTLPWHRAVSTRSKCQCVGDWSSAPPTDDSVFTELNGVLNLLPKWGQERGWCYQAAVNSGILLSGRLIWGWEGGWSTWNRQTAPVSSIASSLSPPPQIFWWNNSVFDGKSPGTRLNGLPLHNSMSKFLIPHFDEFCRRKGGTASTHARLGQLPLSAFLSALFSLPLLKSSLAIFIFFLPPTSLWT